MPAQPPSTLDDISTSGRGNSDPNTEDDLPHNDAQADALIAANVIIDSDPLGYGEAVHMPDSAEWKKAMEEETTSFATYVGAAGEDLASAAREWAAIHAAVRSQTGMQAMGLPLTMGFHDKEPTQ